MAGLELTRAAGEHKLYTLEGVGSLRLHGWTGRAATAEVDGRTWRFTRGGLWRQTIEATDMAGAVAGTFRAQGWKGGGLLVWAGRELQLRRASRWRERYAVADGAHELALLDARGWGKRPVNVTLEDPNAIDAPLLLFATYVVHGLAEDAGAAAAG